MSQSMDGFRRINNPKTDYTKAIPTYRPFAPLNPSQDSAHLTNNANQVRDQYSTKSLPNYNQQQLNSNSSQQYQPAEPLTTKRHWLRWPIRSLPITIGIALALILGAGGAYALYLGAADGPSSSNQASSINLDKGLVSWWRLNGNAKDSTPYTNNGILESAPTLTTDRKGKANAAYSFNGTNQYIATTTQFNNPTVYTISLWFKTSTTAGV